MENEESIQLLYVTNEVNKEENLVGAYVFYKDSSPEHVNLQEEVNREENEKRINDIVAKLNEQNGIVTKHLINNQQTKEYLEKSFNEKKALYVEAVKPEKVETLEIETNKVVEVPIVLNEIEEKQPKNSKIIKNVVVFVGTIMLLGLTVVVVRTREKNARILENTSSYTTEAGSQSELPQATDEDYSELYYALEDYFFRVEDPNKVIDPNLFVILKKFNMNLDTRAQKIYIELKNNNLSYSTSKLRTTENEPLQQELVYGSSDKVRNASDSNLLNTYLKIKEDSIKKMVDAYFKENENRSNLLSAQEAHDELAKILDLTTAYSYIGREQFYVDYKQLISDFIGEKKFNDYGIIANDMGEDIGFQLYIKELKNGQNENSEHYKYFNDILINQNTNGVNYTNKTIVLPEENQYTSEEDSIQKKY